MVGRERTCLFIGHKVWIRCYRSISRHLCSFSTNNYAKDYKDVKTIDDVETKYHVLCSWWLSSGAAIEEDILGLSKWLGF